MKIHNKIFFSLGLAFIAYAHLWLPVEPAFRLDQILTSIPEIKNSQEDIFQALKKGLYFRMTFATLIGLAFMFLSFKQTKAEQ